MSTAGRRPPVGNRSSEGDPVVPFHPIDIQEQVNGRAIGDEWFAVDGLGVDRSGTPAVSPPLAAERPFASR